MKVLEIIKHELNSHSLLFVMVMSPFATWENVP
jgi:hypothetical protein